MSELQRATLGAALLMSAVFGVWLWGREPSTTGSTTAIESEQRADVHARALLRIVATRAELPTSAPEVRWLEGELRYLLIRSQVALARPQGPYVAEEGATIFTLQAVEGVRPAGSVTLSLLSPAGEVERTTEIDSEDATRLGLLRAIAKRLPAFLPRGDTGVLPEQFLGTLDPETYEVLAQAQMAALDRDLIQQSRLRNRDTPIDHLEAVVRRQPDFARGWAELALLYLSIEGQDEASLTAIAEKAARQSLAMDPRLATAHAALGIAQQRQGQWLPADASLAQALTLDPALRPALDAFGCLLIDTGRADYALLIGAQAATVSDSSRSSGNCLEYARMAVAVSPGTSPGTDEAATARPRALAALLEARTDEAGTHLTTITGGAASDAPWFPPVARALRDSRFRPEALRAITLAASDGTLDPATEIMLGIALEQPDFVFNRLLRLHADGKEVPTRFLWIKQTQFLRNHPRFAAVTEQLGLKAYWQERGYPDICRDEPASAVCS